ncbi:MAG: toll/interleukin-1 receptor domain-containing protein [Chloroflexi bacterium]|nr:toll/interleukin-1 receptor domain-containing protein [Chloroflexota bacterium]
MVRSYNFENIRALLILGFSDQELRRLCHDSLIFQPVYHELAQNTGKAEIVDRLLDYANQKEQIEPLLAWANEHNSVRYEKHQPYYEDIADENASVKATTLDSTRKVVQKTQTPPAKSGAAYDVFISYAWEDKPFTALLAIELKARGLRVWWYGIILPLLRLQSIRPPWQKELVYLHRMVLSMW